MSGSDLSGTRILLAGGATGIGAVTVAALAFCGAHVVSLDINDELGQDVADRATVAGPGAAAYLHCDLSRRASVDEAVAAAHQSLGGIDVLMHVAGVWASGKSSDKNDHDLQRTIDVNYRGVVYTNQAVHPFMVDGGSIVNVASAAGAVGTPGAAYYSASKGAVLAWTRAVAQEWGPLGIRVNAVCPAAWTPMYEQNRRSMTSAQLEQHDQAMLGRVPLGGKLGDPARDIAPIMVFLASDASRFVTGQTIAVDGGMLMTR